MAIRRPWSLFGKKKTRSRRYDVDPFFYKHLETTGQLDVHALVTSAFADWRLTFPILAV